MKKGRPTKLEVTFILNSEDTIAKIAKKLDRSEDFVSKVIERSKPAKASTQTEQELKQRIKELEDKIDNPNKTNAGVLVDSKRGVAIFNRGASELADHLAKTAKNKKDTSGYISRPKQ